MNVSQQQYEQQESFNPLRRRLLAGLAAAPLATSAFARSQPFPARNIRLVVPFPAGGGVDVFARPLAAALADILSVPVVVENVGGAASRIGSQNVINANPDGYTLLVTNDTLVAVDAVHPSDAGKSLVQNLLPVSLAIASCNLFVTHPKSGFTDPQGYAEAMRSRPGDVNIGTPGWGTAHHLSSVALNQQLGVTAEHIPYRGGAPLLADVLGGTLDAGVVTMAAALGHIANGSLIGLAVTSTARNAALPNVPTLNETVAPGYEHRTWQGLLAPLGTPADVVARLHEATTQALALPVVNEKLPALGFDPVGAPGKDFATLLNDTYSRFTTVVASANIKPERA